MNYQDCIKFANENPVCYIATADGAQPRVRGFLMWFADENGFYFHKGEAHFWSIEDNMRESEIERITF